MSQNAHLEYRADLDGLRAIAVLAVVGYHAFPKWIPGGFVGVDIFFVISGYLISRIIFQSLANGRFSFFEFYSRRINRLFPALLIVLGACCAFGWLGLLGNEYKQLGKHVAGSAAFVANFVYWREAGYFDTAAQLKPLLHLWSLGIEEQFYLLWPLLLFLNWKRRMNPIWILGAIACASFLYNLGHIRDHAAAAFYSPCARMWELLLGAFLARTSLRRSYRNLSSLGLSSEAFGNIIAVIGLLLIAMAIAMTRATNPFPGWWALLPTTGATLLIAAGRDAWFNRNLLSSRIAVWFGLISYPLYLWHWPLLSFLRIVESTTPSSGYRMAAVSMAVLLAGLTHGLIERPLRQIRNSGAKATLLSLGLLVIGSSGYAIFLNDGFPLRVRYSAEQFKEVAFPNVDECHKRFPFTGDTYCGLSNLSTEPSIMVLGDSHSRAYFIGLRKVFGNLGKSFLSVGVGGCPPFVGVTVQYGGGVTIDCDTVTEHALDYLHSAKNVHTVILAAAWSDYTGVPGTLREKHPNSSTPQEPEEIFSRGLESTIIRLERAGKSVILLHQIPKLDFDPKACKPRPFRISAYYDCSVKRNTVKDEFRKYKALVEPVLARHSAVKQIDPTDFFCDQNNCFAAASGRVIYFDSSHINAFGSQMVGDRLKDMPLFAQN